MEAVKRGRVNPLVEDVALCAELGWTWQMLRDQPVRFIERLGIYLGTLSDIQSREQNRLEDELNRLRRP